ncbi:MAG: sulfatase [Acidobacteriota bacterium]|nr:sulfatase [Acidobacteriota bacterium]
MFRSLGSIVLVFVLVAAMAGCAGGGGGGTGEEVSAVRLVDHFADATVTGSVNAQPPEPTVFSFDEDATGWTGAGSAVGVRAAGGHLVGMSKGPSSVVHVAWQPPEEHRGDFLHSIELRLKTTGGGTMSFTTSNDEELVVGPFLAPGNPFAWSMTSPILPGDDFQSYTLRPVRPFAAGAIQHLLFKPVDAPEIDFEIDSLRVIFEREHLASIPAGVNWQGLGSEYRESLVVRAPEALTFEVDLPAEPVLDVAVGTLENGAVRFGISVEPVGGSAVAVRRTVTEPQEWQPLQVPLDGLGGESVRITLSVEGPREGIIGLWGAPVVRSRVNGLGDRPQAVIAVLIDTLRRDRLPMYGHDRDTAPTLARLVSEGALVEDPISQATWTKVSVPSIFTSLYPTSHGIEDLPDLLPASAETMAEAFRAAGYATFGVSAIPFTGKMTNLHQGYEVFTERSQDLVATGGLADKAAKGYLNKLLPWIEEHKDVPFFAFLHVEDPHSPYFAPPPYATIWGGPGDAATYTEWQNKSREHIDSPIMKQFGMPWTEDLTAAGVDPEAYVAMEYDAYDGLIRSTDDEIARLIERIEALGLRDKVLIAFISDHGTEFLDHDAHFHGQSVYGELNRVPMFFWGPGFVPSGVKIPGTIQNIDFMPTVLDVAGIALPERAQGQSLVPWFDAGGDESAATEGGFRRTPAITEKAQLAFRGPSGFGSYAIISEGWKLIRNPDDAGRPEGHPEFELYDHGNDPLNKQNLANANPEIVERMSKQLDNWLQFAENAKLPSDEDLAASASPEELARLRALGYL